MYVNGIRSERENILTNVGSCIESDLLWQFVCVGVRTLPSYSFSSSFSACLHLTFVSLRRTRLKGFLLDDILVDCYFARTSDERNWFNAMDTKNTRISGKRKIDGNKQWGKGIEKGNKERKNEARKAAWWERKNLELSNGTRSLLLSAEILHGLYIRVRRQWPCMHGAKTKGTYAI